MTDQETQRKVQNHELILNGDLIANPPRPGVMQVLQEMHRTMTHKEHGNEALHQRIATQEIADLKRVAWVKGVKWIAGLILTGLGVLLGYSLHH